MSVGIRNPDTRTVRVVESVWRRAKMAQAEDGHKSFAALLEALLDGRDDRLRRSRAAMRHPLDVTGAVDALEGITR